jgi:hypothetical protein
VIIKSQRDLAQRPLPGRRCDGGRYGFRTAAGFRADAEDPRGHRDGWNAPIRLIAERLGAEIEEIRGTLNRRLTDRDIEVASGTIPAGTCGAVRARAAGVVDGREAIVLVHIIRMSRDVAPDWPAVQTDATYRVDIEGDPDIHCEMTLGDAEGHGAGQAAMAAMAAMAATVMQVVNAIPYVLEAKAGLLTSLDLPNTLPRHVFG